MDSGYLEIGFGYLEMTLHLDIDCDTCDTLCTWRYILHTWRWILDARTQILDNKTEILDI